MGVDAPVTPSPSPNDYVPYTHRYGYDAVGNFTTNQEYKSGTNNLNYHAGSPDLFNGWGAESYSYDANGCCTATPRHQELAYAYDAQPVFVDMGGGTVVRYRRHADQRVARFVSKNGVNGVTVYLGPWEYHRRTGTTSYVKAVLHVDGPARVAQTEEVLSGSDPDSVAVFFVHGDHLGSAQALTDASGGLLSQEEFFAYGRSSDRRNERNRYRYIGVERDGDTHLGMTGPRFYDAALGRFLQGDPIGHDRAMHSPFVYSDGTPAVLSDPTGLSPEEVSNVSDLTQNIDAGQPGDINRVGGELGRELRATFAPLMDMNQSPRRIVIPEDVAKLLSNLTQLRPSSPDEYPDPNPRFSEEELLALQEKNFAFYFPTEEHLSVGESPAAVSGVNFGKKSLGKRRGSIQEIRRLAA